MMNEILEKTGHRPWPMPAGPYVMQMTWEHLLFAHWPVPVEVMRKLVPGVLELDTFDGQCWIGVVPFLMSGVRPHLLPGVPGATQFPEINVRTYVTMQGKPGVYFFSLDAASWLAVKVARIGAHLPYYRANMKCERVRDEVAYESRRRVKVGSPQADFVAKYSPVGPVMDALPGSLDYWLTERYCLYTVWRGRVYRLEIHHGKWPLQPAKTEIDLNTMTAPIGLSLPKVSPVLHFAEKLTVAAWWPYRV